MRNYIVLTTINAPTKATRLFAERAGWQLVVVGDLKTPHEQYADLDCVYLHPDEQRERYPALSEVTGWNTIQRRNLGFAEAYARGAEVVATVDDDNIPYDTWGEDLLVGRDVTCDVHEPVERVFDPLSVTVHRELWHRGYPVQLLERKNEVRHVGTATRRVLVQADLWDGDPDIDAIARLALRPSVTFEITRPYASTRPGPFNSQNTFLHRKVLPYYAVLPFVGRMDDIWASYMLQARFPDCVAYGRATVFQDRNEQDLVTNLEAEHLGYRNTLAFVDGGADLGLAFVPDATRRFYDAYRETMEGLVTAARAVGPCSEGTDAGA